jgi:tetratricopeptide (TPR) repeat protein
LNRKGPGGNTPRFADDRARHSESPDVLARTLYSRGNGYQEKGDYDRAIQDYDQAIRLRHTDYRVIFNRGDVYYDKGDYDRAIQDFDQAIRLNPGFALAISRRADAYRPKAEPVPR